MAPCTPFRGRRRKIREVRALIQETYLGTVRLCVEVVADVSVML